MSRCEEQQGDIELRQCLLNNRLEDALAIVHSAVGVDPSEGHICETVADFMCHHHNSIDNNSEILKTCHIVLDEISRIYKPIDIVLCFIHFIEEYNLQSFFALLPSLQTALLRIPEKRCNTLAWGLNAITACVRHTFKEDHKSDSVTINRVKIGTEVLSFYDPLICQQRNDKGRERNATLLKFIVSLLGTSLVKLKAYGDRENDALIEAVLQRVVCLVGDVYVLLQPEKYSEELAQIDHTSFAILFYLILTRPFPPCMFPQVYHPVYVFQNCLPLVNKLLLQYHDEENDSAQVFAGLKLAENLLERVSRLSLSRHLLDSPQHALFVNRIAGIAIYDEAERHRRFALGLFRHYVLAFENHARYLLLYNAAKILGAHSSLIGYIATLYKDLLCRWLDSAACTSVDTIDVFHFGGINLTNILRLFFRFENENEDLAQRVDQIIAALNLLRYLVIRDTLNVTKIWNYMSEVQTVYLDELKRRLVKWRNEYTAQRMSLHSGDYTKRMQKVTVQTVSGDELPMEDEQAYCAIGEALTSFDVIESVIARLEELIEEKRPSFLL